MLDRFRIRKLAAETTSSNHPRASGVTRLFCACTGISILLGTGTVGSAASESKTKASSVSSVSALGSCAGNPIHIENNIVTTAWREAPLGEVMQCLSQVAGFHYRMNNDLGGLTVSGDFDKVPLTLVLQHLLRDLNSVVLLDPEDSTGLGVRSVFLLGKLTGARASTEADVKSDPMLRSEFAKVDEEDFPPGLLDVLGGQLAGAENATFSQDLRTLGPRALERLLQELEPSLGSDSPAVIRLKTELERSMPGPID